MSILADLRAEEIVGFELESDKKQITIFSFFEGYNLSLNREKFRKFLIELHQLEAYMEN